MNKETITEEIYSKQYSSDQATVRYSDLPAGIKMEDIINITRNPGYYSKNNSWDPFTRLEVFRERPETDKEFNERKRQMEDLKKRSRESKWKKYIELKEEFENDDFKAIK